MTHGVKTRLMIFVVLAAVGVVYVAANYLGLVDRVLGRGYELHVDLPRSGGLYVGSEVAYRGVKVGKVSGMQVTRDGVRVNLQMQQDTKIPAHSPVQVANLSAVGEQYLDFTPSTSSGPFAGPGATMHGTKASLPESTDDLLISLNGFVNSVNGSDLRTTVKELGTMFRGNAGSLQRLLDSGSRFIRAARAHEGQTISLLDNGGQVLRTQQAHAGDILNFAHGLADLTGTLRTSDPQLRRLLQGGPPALHEVHALLNGLQPVLPVFIGNLVTVNQVLTARLPALEELLVVFPKIVSTGFTGTPGDGFGHLSMQFNYKVPVCQKGYLPPSRWPRGTDTRDLPLYRKAHCGDPRAQRGYTGGDPINQRGVNMMPPVGSSGGSAYRVAPYDARTGEVSSGDGSRVKVAAQGGTQGVFGNDAWRWMLVGPVKSVE
ncbi:MAG: MCE family protein [Marmoricola sp.]